MMKNLGLPDTLDLIKQQTTFPYLYTTTIHIIDTAYYEYISIPVFIR
jgi:hypothetical protein